MAAVVTDTHALVWYFLDQDRLSATALATLEQAGPSGDRIYLSAISIVELCYLVEKGKLPPAALERLDSALDEPDPVIAVTPVDLDVARSVPRVPRDLVPDMPDRIIAATALHLGLPLVTRDARIIASGINTVW